MSLLASVASLPTAISIILCLGVYILTLVRGREADLPPGPRPLPLIGNAHQISLDFPEKQFSEWGKRYGVHAEFQVRGWRN